jgi:hypothetical protein
METAGPSVSRVNSSTSKRRIVLRSDAIVRGRAGNGRAVVGTHEVTSGARLANGALRAMLRVGLGPPPVELLNVAGLRSCLPNGLE